MQVAQRKQKKCVVHPGVVLHCKFQQRDAFAGGPHAACADERGSLEEQLAEGEKGGNVALARGEAVPEGRGGRRLIQNLSNIKWLDVWAPVRGVSVALLHALPKLVALARQVLRFDVTSATGCEAANKRQLQVELNDNGRGAARAEVVSAEVALEAARLVADCQAASIALSPAAKSARAQLVTFPAQVHVTPSMLQSHFEAFYRYMSAS